MSPRIISPSREDWDDLPTSLTLGERQVAEWFDRHLPMGWEIYLQPRLNGLQPDFVLLHPDIGVAVYEVKDWNPDAAHYFVEAGKNGPVLKAYYPNNQFPTPVDVKSNPFLRVRDYKDYIHRLCTAAISGVSGNKFIGYGRITAGVIFTVGDSHFWRELGQKFTRRGDSNRLYPVLGRDALNSGRLSWVFPEAANPREGVMTGQVADLLRGWLREPDFVRQQREPLPIPNDVQRRLVDRGPGETGLRRVKGAAGSGKSFALAARAARIALDLVRQDKGKRNDKRVLVVGFNITLSNYLRDLSVRHLRQSAADKVGYGDASLAYRKMIFTHFHEWQSWHDLYDEEAKFDAILVDEGNDFSLKWWHELYDSLKPGGEMMLAFDQTQDVYRQAGDWTEDAMQGAGFRGRWNELAGSYRCHEALMPALQYFANRFMRGIDVNLPEPVQSELPAFYPLKLRWVQIGANYDWISVCVDELQVLQDSLPQDSGYSDVVCLLPEHLEGFNFVQAVEDRLGIDVAHIFSDADDGDDRQRESRPLKRSFWGGNGQMKAVTIHSFKGWEARHLLIYIDTIQSDGDVNMAVLFYTALTRLLRHTGGSLLTVVSSCPQLRSFGQQFFDDFVELETPTWAIPSRGAQPLNASIRH